MLSLSPDLLTNWLQPGAIGAGAVGGLGLLIAAFGNLRAGLKEEMKAGEVRVNRRIDDLKEEMREIRGLLIQELQLSPAAKP